MRTYVGIDFGTSNTHVATCVDTGDGPLTAVPIRFGGRPSIATCVLWGSSPTGEERVEEFGTVAVETWSQYDADERTGRRIAFGFKPDIARSPRSRADAVAFLHKVCEGVLDIQPDCVNDGLVVVGVPAEVGQQHRDRTAEIARCAGFTTAVCVDEPLGALAYHLNNGSISPAEARDGVVIIDFGGGTLDLALVDAEHGLRAPWGDPALGGRLFDDLFYQWVQDQNAPFAVNEHEAMAVWQSECRELKESFSRRWSVVGDGMTDFKYRIDVGDTRKALRNASVAEFIARARAYRPSSLALRYFQAFGLPAPLAVDGPIDLLASIRRTMQRGGEDAANRARFSKVVLTGGSSEWPFMRGIAAEVFGVHPQTGILRSDDPDTTIGAGLALYTALKSRHEVRRASIAASRPKARDALAEAVSARLDRFADRLALAIVNAIMPRIDAVFMAWYHHGGSLKGAEEKVARICAEFEPEAVGLVDAEWRTLDTDLLRIFRDHLLAFLRAHEIGRAVSRYIPASAGTVSLAAGGGATATLIAAELGNQAASLATLAAGIGTLVIATIHLNVVILLAVTHPILAVAAGVGTVASYLNLGAAVGSTVESRVENHEFNPVTRTLLHFALSKSGLAKKLAEGRKTAQTELSRNIMQSLEIAGGGGKAGIVTAAAATFDAVVSQAIADLGVLEQFATAAERAAPDGPAGEQSDPAAAADPPLQRASPLTEPSPDEFATARITQEAPDSDPTMQPHGRELVGPKVDVT